MDSRYNGLVFFDLDGTLLNENSEISSENRTLIKKLSEGNILPLVASGRSPHEIEAMIKDTDINSYISLNGQYIVAQNEVIFNREIAKNDIKNLMLFSQSLGHSLACYTANEYRINFIEDSARKLYQLDNAPLPRIDPYFYENEAIYMLYLFSQQEHKDQNYREQFGDRLTFLRDSPYSLAVVNKGISKKEGIEYFINYLNLTAKTPTYGFGDGNNDLGMFEAVDISIAMGNAATHIQAQADFITKANTKGGIKYALEHFGLV